MLVTGSAFRELSRGSSTLATRMQSTAHGETIMNRLIDELITGDFSTMIPSAPSASTSIEFRRLASVSNGEPVLGNSIHIELITLESNPTDGVDNNNNGLTDECGIRIWEDFAPTGSTPGVEDSPRTIFSRLAPNGLQFTRAGASLIITLTIQQVVGTGLPTQTVQLQSAVKLRNG
jgi:hypothetical protein